MNELVKNLYPDRQHDMPPTFIPVRQYKSVFKIKLNINMNVCNVCLRRTINDNKLKGYIYIDGNEAFYYPVFLLLICSNTGSHLTVCIVMNRAIHLLKVTLKVMDKVKV